MAFEILTFCNASSFAVLTCWHLLNFDILRCWSVVECCIFGTLDFWYAWLCELLSLDVEHSLTWVFFDFDILVPLAFRDFDILSCWLPIPRRCSIFWFPEQLSAHHCGILTASPPLIFESRFIWWCLVAATPPLKIRTLIYSMRIFPSDLWH